ncbi:AAA family ATPase [Dokdonella sp.]|uniref:AAA family ATPase n=1 Tax=Dokdonella sp. TaxID=2291710 RepID=UPI003784B700
MIKSIRLQNFRSIVESNWIDLAPITVVIGKNSAGKSSFLRTLPLLKQSLEADTKEPLLWYGRFVDFGGFSDVVSRYGTNKSLTVGFKVETSPRTAREVVVPDGEQVIVFYEERGAEVFLEKNMELIANLTLEPKQSAEGTYVKKISLRVLQDEIEVIGNEDGVVVALRIGTETIQNVGNVKFRSVRNGFFPTLVVGSEAVGLEAFRTRRDGPFFELILSRLEGLFHGNTKPQTKRSAIRKLKWGSGRNFYSHLISLLPAAESRVNWSPLEPQEPGSITAIRLLVLLRILPEIIASVNAELLKTAGAVRYLAPVRATASRYYRFQELAVDQIDPQGENVPMFLNSLTESQRRELERWMSASLGFNVKSSRSGHGHTALFVREGGDDSGLNLADTGFGYSQILPVALQIWKSLQDNKDSKVRRPIAPSVIVIEQPELHLHPQFQAALADIFASSIASRSVDGRPPVSFIIETHSEHLVNRLGELVQGGKLDSSNVRIVLFEKKSPNQASEVRSAAFGSDGAIEGEWPFGFFVPQFP